ncbi:MAG: esterase/lipase family protein [Steroidobacteraceae bacterium]
MSRSASPPSVLFVHGLWMTGVEGFLLRQRLERAGYATHNFAYSSHQATVEEVLSGLEVTLRNLPPPVHLVGHSLGGLMLLRLFELRPDQPPGRVVLLGSPAGGSAAARPVARWTLGPTVLGHLALREIVERRQVPWTASRELGVIAGSSSLGLGRLVADLPEPNDGAVAVEETRVEGATEHLVLPVSHSGMLVSGEVAERVASFLARGRF